MNFMQSKIRFAFGIEGFLDKELKNDPRYVKSFARMYGRKDGKNYEKFIDFHVCTDDDYALFSPPAPESESMLESMKTREGRGLYCMDWDALADDIEIWSVSEDDNYQRWEFVLLPCNYVHAEFGDVGDFVGEECIADLDTQTNYLGNMKSIIYIDEEVFNQNEFGEYSISKRSKFFAQ